MPPELPAALADVRSDASSTNWCLCGFEAAGLGLAMMGSGGGHLPQHRTLTLTLTLPLTPNQVRDDLVMGPLHLYLYTFHGSNYHGSTYQVRDDLVMGPGDPVLKVRCPLPEKNAA